MLEQNGETDLLYFYLKDRTNALMICKMSKNVGLKQTGSI